MPDGAQVPHGAATGTTACGIVQTCLYNHGQLVGDVHFTCPDDYHQKSMAGVSGIVDNPRESVFNFDDGNQKRRLAPCDYLAIQRMAIQMGGKKPKMNPEQAAGADSTGASAASPSRIKKGKGGKKKRKKGKK